MVVIVISHRSTEVFRSSSGSSSDKSQSMEWVPRYLVIHCGPDQPRIQTEILGHSLVHSLVRLHCSLVCLLRTTPHYASLARSAALTRSLARSLCSLPYSWESE